MEILELGLKAFVWLISAALISKAFDIVENSLKIKKEKAIQEKNMTAKTAYDFALSVLEGITSATVYKIESTKAASIREAVKAGKEPISKLTGLSDEAYEEIISQLTPEIKEALELSIDKLELFIKNKIEEVLPTVKTTFALMTKAKDVELKEQYK